MNLRTRILLLLSVIVVLATVVSALAIQGALVSSFAQLEERQTRLNAERLLAALQADLDTLARSARDWAGWDDTYDYAVTRDLHYQQDNLELTTTYTNHRIHVLLVIDRAGQLLFARGYDYRGDRPTPLPEGLLERVGPGSPLLRHNTTEDATSGLLQLPAGPLLFSAQPIVTSEREGPVRGTLVWARLLDAAELADLGRRTLQHVEGFDPRPGGPPPDVASALAAAARGPVHAQVLDAERIAGYAVLTDVFGEPALVLRSVDTRSIYGQGMATLLLVVGLVAGTGLAFGTAILFAVDRFVLAKLDFVNRQVQHVAQTGDVGLRIDLRGRDEFARLGAALNSMLGALAEAQRSQRAYQARLQELADRDALTGLYNRRAYEREARLRFQQAEQRGVGLALLVLDIDHFKAVNDRLGHRGGDRVLRLVADSLRAQAPEGAVLARVGGDEFALVLLGFDAVKAEHYGHRLVAGIWNGRSPESPSATISGGLAVYPEHGKSLDALELCADRALYRAKAEGRARLVVEGAARP